MSQQEQAASTIDAISRSNGWTVEAILADPRRIDLNDHRAREFLTQNRSTLEPGLLRKARTSDAKERLRIGTVLLETGAPSGSPLVLDALADPDPEVVWAALSFCRFARWFWGKGLLVPLDQPAAAAALQPFLSAPDPAMRAAAMAALCRLSDEGAVERLAQLLTHADLQVRAAAARTLADYHGDGRAWPVIRSLFETTAPNEGYRPIRSLQGFALCEDQSIRDQAAAFARRELAALYDRGDNGAANEASNLLEVLKKLAPPWELEVLQEVIASKMAAWVKASAAGRLALAVEAATAEQYMLAWLDHAELAAHRFEILRKLGAKVNTPAIVERLRAELDAGATGKHLEQLLDTLIAIKVEGADLGRFADQVQGWRRFELIVRSKRVTADVMLGLLDRAELIPMAGRDARTRFAEEWLKDDCFGSTMELLSGGGRFHGFDCEDTFTPPDYPSLVGELVALADGEIASGRVTVAVTSEAGLEVRIDTPTQRTTLELQYQGDWIDVDGLLSGLNYLLSAQRSPRRYLPLAAEGQWAMVVLARTEALEALVKDYAFPVGDPNEARRLGQAYEAQVVGKA